MSEIVTRVTFTEDEAKAIFADYARLYVDGKGLPETDEESTVTFLGNGQVEVEIQRVDYEPVDLDDEEDYEEEDELDEIDQRWVVLINYGSTAAPAKLAWFDTQNEALAYHPKCKKPMKEPVEIWYYNAPDEKGITRAVHRWDWRKSKWVKIPFGKKGKK